MIKTRLVGLLSHAKKYIVYTILWQWAALLSQVLAVFTIAELLERVVYRAVTVPVIERTILILVLVVIIRFVCERMGARSSYLACVDVKRILREKIYDKMLKLGASYSEQVSSSEVVQVSTEGVEQLETYFGKYLPQLFYSLIAPLTLFLILCRVSLKASVILLICLINLQCRQSLQILKERITQPGIDTPIFAQKFLCDLLNHNDRDRNQWHTDQQDHTCLYTHSAKNEK